MTEEIAKLEANLSRKHEEEFTQFKSDNKVTSSVYSALSLSVCLTS